MAGVLGETRLDSSALTASMVVAHPQVKKGEIWIKSVSP